ncbi:DUF2806 domain-containing protein [Vibrio sp. RM-69-4]|uniref:DUF2806 domain-containing protein n=1 Tax=Vibrio sp. RM-69-4 TaxID=2950157 RepID=UPI00215B8F77|nr:DUF2806 domain-containing protein [Vibrio sp. RM-69-4]MCR9421737.1 DUF2806 domain-containing protein [Vibrio sp. RM-69-4]
MSEEKALINIELGKFGDAVNTLTTKVCDAVGVLYRPRAIVKEAEALAKVREIELQSELRSADIKARTLARVELQEQRKQANYESILAQTIERLPENAKPENLDEDWLAYFFERCATVSDKDMQFLWASLLSAEAEKSGTFSKRTIEFISTVSKNEALKFTELCQLIVNIHDDEYVIVDDLNASNIHSTSLQYADLVNMESIGLIAIGGSYRANQLPRKFEITYFEESINISLPERKNSGDLSYDFDIGEVVLTSLGHEVSKLCETKPNMTYFNYLKDLWRKRAFIEPEPIA